MPIRFSLLALLFVARPEPSATGSIGGPVAAPFQQEVRYTIEAELDEGAELLRGRAVFAYRNQSPDTLRALYFHLHLNAFRPHSLWARSERRPEYDFQTVGPKEQAFERLAEARADGGSLDVVYPFAPDSTVARLALPVPLAPGDTLSLKLGWLARPSTRCRRQCRLGRHYDFAQWYPRIAVYDRDGWHYHPLYPQGEFYGEFATYDVTLDLAADQVVAATGVPISGDPGWSAAAPAAAPEPALQRDWYGAPSAVGSTGRLTAEAGPGRKRVRFFARDVHHFAWSVDPEFRYEGALLRPDLAVHVLYRPGGGETWGGGLALERTIAALRWLEHIFGPYPYPQLTNLQRLESGGTEFPMLVMNGSASEGLIVHEVSHQYVHGILANNEWREAWLDEGFATFLTAWYAEERGDPGVWMRMLENAAALERMGVAEPVSTPAKDFSSFELYGAMSYTKAALIFRMLQGLIGEEAFRRTLRAYQERHALGHVKGTDFERAAEEVSGRPLEWFFEAWLDGTGVLDYAIGAVQVQPLPAGGWRVVVELMREGENWMPVAVAAGDGVVVAESRERRQLVEVITARRPDSVQLDPGGWLLDVDRTNNQVELGR